MFGLSLGKILLVVAVVIAVWRAWKVVGPLVEEIVEHRRPRAELLERGYPVAVVDDCLARIARAEYKRRQAPPGIKVSGKAFGVGRRIPIAHPYRSP